MTSVCPHCRDPNTQLEYTRLERWTVVRYPAGGNTYNEEGEFKRIVRQPSHGKCSSCKRRVRL